MEACAQFGELPPDLAEKVKYAKWRFVEIAKAVKERRPPAPPRGMDDADDGASAPPPPEVAAPPPSMPDASGYDSMIPPPAAPAGYPDYMGLPPADQAGYPGGAPQHASQPPAAVPTAPPVSHGVPSFGIPSPPGGVPAVPQHVPPAYGAPPQMPSAMMGAVPGFKPGRCVPHGGEGGGSSVLALQGRGSRHDPKSSIYSFDCCVLQAGHARGRQLVQVGHLGAPVLGLGHGRAPAQPGPHPADPPARAERGPDGVSENGFVCARYQCGLRLSLC